MKWLKRKPAQEPETPKESVVRWTYRFSETASFATLAAIPDPPESSFARSSVDECLAIRDRARQQVTYKEERREAAVNLFTSLNRETVHDALYLSTLLGIYENDDSGMLHRAEQLDPNVIRWGDYEESEQEWLITQLFHAHESLLKSHIEYARHGHLYNFVRALELLADFEYIYQLEREESTLSLLPEDWDEIKLRMFRQARRAAPEHFRAKAPVALAGWRKGPVIERSPFQMTER